MIGLIAVRELGLWRHCYIDNRGNTVSMKKCLNSGLDNSLVLQQLWSDIVAIYGELPRTENSINHDVRMRRRQLMESLSAKLAQTEALISLGSTPGPSNGADRPDIAIT